MKGAKENIYQVCFQICPWHTKNFYCLFSFLFILFCFFLNKRKKREENKINLETVFGISKQTKCKRSPLLPGDVTEKKVTKASRASHY